MENKKSLIRKVRQHKWLYIMLLPGFIAIFFFSYLPLSGWYIAFSDYQLGKSIFGGEWAGLKYFDKIINESSDLIYLIKNTVVMNGVSLVLNIAFALMLAILLKEFFWKPGSKVVQTVSLFPYFISWVIIYAIVSSLFSVNSGVINQTLVKAGVLRKGLNLLGDPKYSWGLIILLNLWKTAGYNTVIFLSSISGIPLDQYESAAIDGAGRLQRIRYITLPNLLPTASVLLIMNAGWIFNSNLEQFFVFQNSTNWPKMEVLDMYIYKFGFKLLNFPYSTAMSMIKNLVSVVMLLCVNAIVKKMNDVSIV